MSLTFLPTIERLSSRVIRILGCNPSAMTLQGTNTYLVGQGKNRILIDSSGGETINEYIDVLSKELNNQNCKLQEILITHWHSDHTEGVQPIFKSITKTPIKVSKHELTEGGCEHDQVTKYNYINDNHVFKTEGATLRAIYTPGHSTDHLSFFLEEENALFSGDCILGETTAQFEDLHVYMESLKKIAQLKTNVIYPGHGPMVNDCCDRIEQYIQHRNKRNSQIMEALRKSSSPMDIEELIKEIYIGLDEMLIPAASVNVQNHLSALLKQKLVDETSDYRWIAKKTESKI